ncbi:biopolymer transporter ExbD [Acinetobacter wanghuae]|uniref:Biopolymer transporter ExbD n=1 Tax=Acinetobacter wanghuae TaxID=2662362 RepID=A0A5Q0P1C6_9GAMM|nr:biopolymer transporter ExbD [Acinetobacter wanghuae]MQW90932.1 biopolymer transporter ExbD [Acinetobacter wanghuae]QGA10240.1 biopolymer transporter ExbD [Acinetobacter wanghuae]
MAFQLGEDNDTGMNEMNLIPLIDIMLVLMIIFLVTATVANPSIPLNLPEMTDEIHPPPPESVTVNIKESGEIVVDNRTVTFDELHVIFQEKAAIDKKTSIQLQADGDTRYDNVGQVMKHASEAGLSDIAFVSKD